VSQHSTGLTTKDLARRAIEMEMPNIGHLRVIHPIDELDSRIQNLHMLPEKRTDAGIAQARLAVDVARAFIRRMRGLASNFSNVSPISPVISPQSGYFFSLISIP
jgi:hypothetical protein